MAGEDLHFGFGVQPEGGEPTPEFVQLLESWRLPLANTDQVQRGRQAFLGLAAATQGAAETGQPSGSETPSAQATLGSTLLNWSGPTPRPEFQTQLKTQWMKLSAETQSKPDAPEAPPREAARVAAPAKEGRSRAARKPEARKPGTPERAPRARSGPPWRALVPIYAVMLGLVFWMLLRDDHDRPENPGASIGEVQVAALWSMPDGLPASAWTIDGQPVTGTVAEVQTALERGQTLVAPADAPLRLAYGRLFQIALSPGSALDLGAMHAAAGTETMRLVMPGGIGGYAIETGPDFKSQGRRMVFATPDAEVEVTGTVFAIDRYASGTCVCCAHGAVMVRGGGQELSTAAGSSQFVTTGGECHTQDVPTDHLAPMDALQHAPRPANWPASW